MATTATQIRKNSRRLDRINSIVSSILAAMQAGQSLHCEFGPRGPNWKLSNGRHLADEVARIVIANHSVAAVGDALWRTPRHKRGGTCRTNSSKPKRRTCK